MCNLFVHCMLLWQGRTVVADCQKVKTDHLESQNGIGILIKNLESSDKMESRQVFYKSDHFHIFIVNYTV